MSDSNHIVLRLGASEKKKCCHLCGKFRKSREKAEVPPMGHVTGCRAAQD